MHIKYKMKTLSLVALMSVVPTLALGHSGHHGETSLLAALQHIAQSPFHTGVFALAAIVIVAGVIFMSRRLKARERE